jgi:phosphoribosylformylglycinamidine synthase
VPLLITNLHAIIAKLKESIRTLAPLGVAMAMVVVNVALKPEILDPQGRAVLGALGRLGLSGVADVRQGKQFVLNIDGEIDAAKLAQFHEIASTLLSNPVIEDFTVEVQG